MARSTRSSLAATGNVPTTSHPVEVGKLAPPIGSSKRTSSTGSINRRVVYVNGEESELLDSQEATRFANEATENVFLFVPNLIGELLLNSGERRARLISVTNNRVCESNSGRSITILYEVKPKDVHIVVWCFRSSGCSRWASCQNAGTKHKVWCRSRYGDGSVKSIRCFVYLFFTVVQRHVFSSFCRLPTQTTPFYFKRSSPSTLAATTFTCTALSLQAHRHTSP
jgi:hypothetical protein